MKSLESKIQEINTHGILALVAFMVKRLLPKFQDSKDDYKLIGELAKSLWKYQETYEIKGKSNMSESNAKKMYSYKVYRKYVEDLLGQSSLHYVNGKKDTQLYKAYCAVIQLFFFFCWKLDGRERFLNEAKPFVFDSDITDGGYHWLIEGLSWAEEASSNPEEERAWQEAVILRLVEHYGIDTFEQKGVEKDFFVF